MEKNTTLVIGASENTDRYSNMAVRSLLSHGYKVAAIGARKGEIHNVPIEVDTQVIQEDIDTVSLYVNPSRQAPYYDIILSLKPRRVIFNPGTENPAFMEQLKGANIEPIEACTLVMLSTGQY